MDEKPGRIADKGVATPEGTPHETNPQAEMKPAVPKAETVGVRSKVGIGFVADKYGGISFVDSQVAQVSKELAARMVAEDPDEYELA